jgi:F0F1-type ATP synthase assembly protein I
MTQDDSDRRKVIWTLLIVLVGQVGCLTLAIMLASVVGGLWLDAHFHTKPMFTLALLLAGIPLSVLLMLQVARKTLSKLKHENEMTTGGLS